METVLPESVVRQASVQANVAQIEAVCRERRPFCLLTEAAARAALQPFVYLDGSTDTGWY